MSYPVDVMPKRRRKTRFDKLIEESTYPGQKSLKEFATPAQEIVLKDEEPESKIKLVEKKEEQQA
jgi:hypothetical protein